MNTRTVSWLANKIVFDEKIEKLLSHCPNMSGEDDMRDVCKGLCILYEEYCISIEPSYDCLDRTKTDMNNEAVRQTQNSDGNDRTDVVKASQLGFEVPEVGKQGEAS